MMRHGSLRAVIPRRARRGSLQRWTHAVEHGRFQRQLAAATAVSALVTSFEIAVEHYRASYGDPWMWAPLAATPPVLAAGAGGVVSERVARTALPAAGAVYLAQGLLGVYLHVRGIGRRPGGWQEATYNVVMGPPLLAPGLMTVVGAMGIVAGLLRREGG